MHMQTLQKKYIWTTSHAVISLQADLPVDHINTTFFNLNVANLLPKSCTVAKVTVSHAAVTSEGVSLNNVVARFHP